MKRFFALFLGLALGASAAMAQSAAPAAAAETESASTQQAVYTLQKTEDGYKLEGTDAAPATQKAGLHQAVEQANGGAKPAGGCCAKKGDRKSVV